MYLKEPVTCHLELQMCFLYLLFYRERHGKEEGREGKGKKEGLKGKKKTRKKGTGKTSKDREHLNKYRSLDPIIYFRWAESFMTFKF